MEQVNLLFQQQRIGAQVDILLARHQPFHDLGYLRMHQRLSAGNRHHRRAALVYRSKALFRRKVLLQHVRRVLDLATAGTSQVAAKQWLQHQNQWIPPAPPYLLF